MNRTGSASRSFPGGVRPGQVLVEGRVEEGRGGESISAQVGAETGWKSPWRGSRQSGLSFRGWPGGH